MMHSPVGAPGKYELLFELGRGGMSRIYLAVIRGPAGFSKLVVIKRLHEDLASEPEFRTMFHEEARLSARLNHPNIVQVNEVGDDGVHFDIEMEYLEGHSLDAIVRRAAKEGGLPVALHLRILSEALAGLHYAHELQDFEGQPLHLVHRDVSPHNIFVTYDGHVKLVDFGIAKAADSVQHTRTGVLKGKCAYMAPEQLLTLPIDRRIDIYAMGVMLWQVASERKLWKGLSDVEIFQRVASAEIPRPSSVKPDVSVDLEAITMKALARKADDRFATAEELRFAINDYLSASSGRVDERDVSQYVSRMFDKERRQVRSAVETQMRKESPPSQPVIPPIPTMTASGTMAVNKPDRESYPPIRRSHARTVIGVAFLGIAAASGGAGYHYLHHTNPTNGTIAALPPSSASAEADVAEKPTASGHTAPAPTESIDFTITAAPADARLSVDDVRMASNPARQEFVRDGKVHHIVGTAPGYAPSEQYVKFEAPTGSVQLTLTKLPVGAPYRPPAKASNKGTTATSDPNNEVPPPAPPAPAAPAASATAPAKKTNIDQDNPYSK